MAALIAVGLAFIATTAQAASIIRYVTTNGTDSGNCDLPGTPCAKIAYALSKSSAGDDIRVGSGTYSELEISVSIAVTITGGFDVNGPTNWDTTNFTSTPTILDGGNTHRLLYISSDKAVVQFMTIRNGNATAASLSTGEGGGVAVVNAKNVLLRGLTITGNTASTNNIGSTGGGVALLNDSVLTIDRSLVLSNTAFGIGGGIGLRPDTGQLASLFIDSSVVAHNSADKGGAFAASGDGRSGISTNFVTMADNGSAPESIYLIDGSNTPTKQDFILFQFMLTSGNPTIITTVADLEPTVNFNGLMADPSITTPYSGFSSSFPPPVFRSLTFVNAPRGDYHLPKGSPAIDVLGKVDKIDLEGRVRDIGLTQCTPFFFCPLGLGTDYGAYEYVYTAPSIRYVALEGNDQDNNCLNPEFPCKTLGAGNRFALGGDEVRLTRGTHILTDGSTFCNNQAIVCISQGITLTGGFTTTNWNTASTNPSLTVLDGGGTHQGIRIAYNAPLGSSLIRNITVRHGYSIGNGGGIAVGDNASPTQNTTIHNCRVEQSRGDGIGDGGGIFALSPANLRVTNCTLNDNFLPDGRGGGIAIDDANGVSTYTLSSLVVFNNFANSIGQNSTNGGMGGGIFLQGVGTLQQSEIFSNTANMSGGGVTTGSNHSNPLIDRVYIHDNKAGVGGGYSIFLTGGATLQNSLLVRNATTSTVPLLNMQILGQPFLGGNAIFSPYNGEPDEPLRVINVTIADNKGAVDDAVNIEGLANGDNSRRNFFTNVLISGSKVGMRTDGNGFADLTTVLMTNDVITKTDNFTPTRLTGAPPLTGARGFVGANDYHLQPSAAGVDQGTTVVSVTQDLDGVFRPLGPKYDIGAYETTKNKQNQSITFDNPGDHALADSPFPVHPTSSAGLPVQLVSNTPTVCTVSALNVTLLHEGACTLKASQPGNATFNAAADVIQSFEVTIAAPKAKLRLPMLENEK